MRCAAIALVLSTTGLLSAGQLADEIKHIAEEAHGRIGVACSIPGAELDCNVNAPLHLPMQSVYKLPIGLTILHEVEQGKFTLETNVRFLPSDLISPGQHSPLRDAHPQANVDVPIRELLRYAVSESDGVASDILVRVLGGPGVVDRYIHTLSIGGIRILDTEKSIGADVKVQYRNWAEAGALVALLRRIADNPPVNAEHTALLLKLMTETPTGEHRLKALLPPGTGVAHKTGTSGTGTSGKYKGITNATNDVGLVTMPDGRKLAIAVLLADSPASEEVRERVIARVAKAIWDVAVALPPPPRL